MAVVRTAAQNGAPLLAIRTQARHRSVQVARGTVRDAEPWRDNVTNRLLYATARPFRYCVRYAALHALRGTMPRPQATCVALPSLSNAQGFGLG